ncbi:glycosyltransferase family 2 protein [Methylophaga sp.]|uniref:glycosyltransferase family 2 protein n=1 Tax=Methylophaga sp. TaxID=2024840 RepID=UPI001400733F|nr:glycosyltransferase family 2 protein [Methylophaga sp.]MTI64687.1 glycosyltransferase family 2 protein [Methylophaga sp.]
MNQTESRVPVVVSTIMPLHNAADFVEQAIKSVLDQTFQDWELLIIDDKSTDGSVEIVKSFVSSDNRIKLIQLEQNSGAAVARNTGFEAAKGRYIAFLDSDDIWLPEKLEKQIHFMQKTACPFTYTAYGKINEQGQWLGKVGVPEDATYKSLLKTCFIGCLTVMIDTAYFGKVTMPLLRKRQDYGLWLQLLKQAEKAKGLPEVLAHYRVHKASISANKLHTATYTWRLYREVENLSLPASIYYFSHYAVRGFMRHRLPRLARAFRILH